MRISGGEYIKKKLFYTYIGKIVGKGAKYNKDVELKFEVGVGGAKKRIDALLRIGRKVNMAVEMVDGNSEDKIKDVTAELLKIETVPEITHFFIHFDDGAILVDRKGIEGIAEGGGFKVVDTEKLFDDLEIILSKVPTSDFKENEADKLLSYIIGLAETHY